MTSDITWDIYTGWFDTYKQTKITNTAPKYAGEVGYKAMNLTNTLTSNIEGKSQAWFFDQHKQTKVSSTYPEYNSYLGFYWYYKTNTITLDKRPIIKTPSTQSSWWSSSKHCATASKVTNISATLESRWLYPQIKIQWDTRSDNEQQKIIIYSPKIEYITLAKDDNNYNLDNIKENTLYMGAIMNYNDCWNFSYSEAFEIRTKKLTNTSLDLTYQDNIFTLHPWDTINTHKNIRLTCRQNDREIISELFPTSLQLPFIVPSQSGLFECRLQYYTFPENQIKTSLFWFGSPKISKLTAEMALWLIYLGENNINILWQDTYFLHSELSSPISYSDAALVITNTYGGIYMTEKTCAFDMFQRLWFIKSKIHMDDEIPLKEYLSLLSFIQEQNNLQTVLVDDMSDNYVLQPADIIGLTQRTQIIYHSLQELKSRDITGYNNILSCLTLQWCQNTSAYNDFISNINEVSTPSRANFPISIASGDITWADYVEILYATLWYDNYISQEYSQEEYQSFITILQKSIIQDDDFYQQKMDYFDLHRINISLYSSHLPPKIEKLSKKSLKIINQVYPKLVNKDRLFILLNDYLQQ